MAKDLVKKRSSVSGRDFTPKSSSSFDIDTAVKKKKKKVKVGNDDAELSEALRKERAREKAYEKAKAEGQAADALKAKKVGLKKKKAKNSSSVAVVLEAAESRRTKPVSKERKSDLLALLPEAPKRISRLKTKNMRSIIGDSAESIQQLLESGDNDNATTLLQKRMLQALVDLVPYAEHNIRTSKGRHGVYQINALMQSIREIIIDVQAANDRGAIGIQLVEQVLQPMMMEIAMTIMTELDSMKGDTKDLMDEAQFKTFRTELMNTKTRIGSKVQSLFVDARTRTLDFLQA